MTERTAQQHIEAVRTEAEQHLNRADSAAKVWRQWANALDQLAREMPHVPGGVVGVDDCAETYTLDLGLPHVDGTAMRDQLNITKAHADAIASALGRGRYLVKAANEQNLAYLEAAAVAEPEHVGATEEYAAELHAINGELAADKEAVRDA